MADKDVSRLAVERAANVLGQLRQYFILRVPYGPATVRRTPREARLEVQQMDLPTRMQVQQQVGPAEWAKLMEELYGGS